ncbi:MAG: imidazole glycerol phosphate synthase subunit HisH [Devosiaceae bacterium]|nr:imidazole glycerol phosphate synthase subunit HisH [Devosiaceae bacterium]
MSQLITIIDYGSGNLRSAQKAFQRAAREADIEANIVVTNSAERVVGADRIVLPGVGAFADCRAGLFALPGMRQVLKERVIEAGVPFFGICVGMQLMAQRGLEKGTHEGFGWIEGEVVPLSPKQTDLKIPHMGWNTLSQAKDHPLFEDINTGPNGLHAYFVHSFHMQTTSESPLLATTEYGQKITAAVSCDNMVGTQFHPEKSQKLGLAMITNFLRWKP